VRVEVFYDFAEPACFAAHERARSRWALRGLRFAWVPWEAEVVDPPGRARAPEERRLSSGLQACFEEEGLPFRASALRPSTGIALRAATWCEERGVGEDFRDGVFRRLYGRGLDTHCYMPDVLAGIVERCGLDPIAFLDDLKEGACAAELHATGERARALGLQATPSFVAGGRILAWVPDFARMDAALEGFVRGRDDPRVW
jgi:predicted DsbA family dithiol-disulfide isomerase